MASPNIDGISSHRRWLQPRRRRLTQSSSSPWAFWRTGRKTRKRRAWPAAPKPSAPGSSATPSSPTARSDHSSARSSSPTTASPSVWARRDISIASRASCRVNRRGRARRARLHETRVAGGQDARRLALNWLLAEASRGRSSYRKGRLGEGRRWASRLTGRPSQMRLFGWRCRQPGAGLEVSSRRTSPPGCRKPRSFGNSRTSPETIFVRAWPSRLTGSAS